ncbi:SDR family oxidoreductase [Thalassococcus sp. S3]|uniref:SDR family NAD(P)-dependent oxidoreductase n=1 Tax=Thalassococcus sp. S3 TaxID=2017482 RepID=UPI00102452F0|nr:SDR family NAD(P)-dependent oxidoreductase [Thalassococcus sp. S3]QBF29657.1 short-chain dehydrogenase [Thalassococcus sp. S3]
MTSSSQFMSALITGASSGLGAAMADKLAGPDRSLCLLGRNAERLSAVAERCRARGAKVETHLVDVADADAMHATLSEADERLRFDLVFVSAGVAFGRETPDTARQTVETNVLGVINTIAPVEPGLIARGTGQIALLSSLAAFRVLGGPGSYAGSKAWVRIYGEALRGQLASKGVGVSVICPGFVDTPMIDERTRKTLPEPPMPADQAADLILDGLIRNAPRISFPRKSALQIWWLAMRPAWLTDRRTMRRFQAARDASEQS